MDKETKKEWTQINISEKTKEQIEYTALVLNKSISGFLEELFNAVIQQSVNFKPDNRANVQYRVEYDDIILRFSGSKIVFVDKCHSEQELMNIQAKTINEDLKRKAMGLKP
jgi:hypothetical protein